jgi:hypothetical protein
VLCTTKNPGAEPRGRVIILSTDSYGVVILHNASRPHSKR